jgi:hypothetical protein
MASVSYICRIIKDKWIMNEIENLLKVQMLYINKEQSFFSNCVRKNFFNLVYKSDMCPLKM